MGHTESCLNCRKCPTSITAEWGILYDDELEAIDHEKISRSYQAGEMVFHQGASCKGIYCIQSGLIGLRRVDEDGNSALLRLCNSGETLGYRALLSNHDHLNTAEILAPGVVCLVPRSVVSKLLRLNPRLGESFLQHCIGDITGTESAYARSLTLKMKSRLLHVLMFFYERVGYRDELDDFVIELPIQRQQLADMLGSTPESVSRMIRKLESDGLLRFNQRRVSFSSMDAIFQEIGSLH